jgi:hypothetical protein
MEISLTKYINTYANSSDFITFDRIDNFDTVAKHYEKKHKGQLLMGFDVTNKCAVMVEDE